MAYAVDPVPGFHLSDPTIVSSTRRRHRAIDSETLLPATVTLLMTRPDEDGHAVALRRELQALQRLSAHPHALTITDVGFTADRRPYFVHPRVSERTLATRLGESPVPVQAALTVAIKLASALDVAHGVGITHGQITTETVLLQDGQPILADFELASLAEGANHIAQQPASPFVAPEGAVSPEADRYALGALLLTMVHATPADTAETAPHDREIPEELDWVISRLMHAEPDQRPANLRGVISQLQALQHAAGAPVTAVTAPDGTLLSGPANPLAMRRTRRRASRAQRTPRTRDSDRVGPLIALIAGVLLATILVAASIVLGTGRTSTDTASGDTAATTAPSGENAAAPDATAPTPETTTRAVDDPDTVAASPEATRRSATNTPIDVQLVDPADTVVDEVLGAVIDRGSRGELDQPLSAVTLTTTTTLNRADPGAAFSVSALRVAAPVSTVEGADVAYVIEVATAAGELRGSNLCLTSQTCDQRMQFDPPVLATAITLRLIDEPAEPLTMDQVQWCIIDGSGSAHTFGLPAETAPQASTGWCE